MTSSLRKTKTNIIIYKIAYTALLSALTFIATYFISMPYANGAGYFNLSDSLIIFSTIYFGPIVGIFSGIIGTVIADIVSGYASAAIFTLFAKALEGIAAYLIYKLFKNKKYLKYIMLYISCIPMILTYFIYYLSINDFNFLTSYIYSLFDIVQGIIGVSFSIILLTIFDKINIKGKNEYND